MRRGPERWGDLPRTAPPCGVCLAAARDAARAAGAGPAHLRLAGLRRAGPASRALGPGAVPRGGRARRGGRSDLAVRAARGLLAGEGLLVAVLGGRGGVARARGVGGAGLVVGGAGGVGRAGALGR